MHSKLKTFNTIRLQIMNYFLEIFIVFFHFLNSNSNLNFATGFYRWVPLPYPSGSSGNRGIPRGYHR
jgi:hypothetical protein